jgi:hypothetical protein
VTTFKDLVPVNGTLRQFADSVVGAAIRMVGNYPNVRLVVDARGNAEDSRDPGWLMAEDCAQSPVGFGAVTYWEPDLVEIQGGQPVTFVVEAFDLARRVGLRVTVPMVANRKNPFVRTPTGRESTVEIGVPGVGEPRYESWDLAKFTLYAEAVLVRGARGASKVAKYAGTASQPARQEYAQMAEYSGFAFIDRALTLREANNRTGRYWMRQPLSLVWKPGEIGAQEQLLAVARKQTREDSPGLSFAALWWSDGGVTQARFADLGARRVWAGTWRIKPGGGLANLVLRAVGAPENEVIRVTPNAPLDYTAGGGVALLP